MLAGRREDWPGAEVELLAGTPWQKGKPPQREGRGKKAVASKKKARQGEQEKAGRGEQEKSQPAVAAT